ncbi:MAG: hypothetical protein WBD24_02105 [Candidatus Omnitrophota bacterium]
MVDITFLPVFVFIGIINLFIGSFLFLKPELSIEIQIRFYEKINWRIEPISMRKEVRNTRLMGILLIAVTSVLLVCALTQKINI